MRTISLVNCVVLKVTGSILKNAVCFGDVDNDGLNEFIIGSSEGELNIFREDQCICTASDLGTIATVAVGDLLNISRNVLVVVTVEGWCHVFDVEAELGVLEHSFQVTEGDSSPQLLRPETSLIWPYHSQRVPPNTKTLHLGDVNGDGLIEMVIGLTDRVVRTYQWKTENQEEDKSEDRRQRHEDVLEGRLHGMNKWEFSSQVGSIALHNQKGIVSILVGQPGGTVKRITESPLFEGQDESESKTIPPPSSSTSTITSSLTSKISKSESYPTQIIDDPNSMGNISIDYYALEINQMHNQNISSEVAGNVASPTGDDNDSYAVATLDGNIIIARENEIQWSFQVHHQIMSLFQVDGNLLVCTWDGETYYIQKKTPTRFHFEDSVAAFVPGIYALRDAKYQSMRHFCGLRPSDEATKITNQLNHIDTLSGCLTDLKQLSTTHPSYGLEEFIRTYQTQIKTKFAAAVNSAKEWLKNNWEDQTIQIECQRNKPLLDLNLSWNLENIFWTQFQ